MELRHLRYFVAVAEELHMGRAAARLHISQPPLSQQIAALESEIGTLLFIRRGRGLCLSAAGSAFLEYARQTLVMAEHAVAVAREVGHGETGRLSVGYVSSLTYTYLPAIIQRFRQAYPRVGLSLHEMSVADQVRSLHERSLQIGLLRGPLENAGLECDELVAEPFMLALPVAHALTKCGTVGVAQLRDETFIVHLGGVFYGPLLRLCRRAGFDPVIVQEVTQIHAAVGLVGAGMGVALERASARALKIDGVAFRPIDGQDVTTSVLLATPAEERSLLVRNFQAAARTAIGGSPAEAPAGAPVAIRS